MGVFIEGYWDDNFGEMLKEFQGFEWFLVLCFGQLGMLIMLVIEWLCGMIEGVLVLFCGLLVGQMQNLCFVDDDEGVLVDVFIFVFYDKLLIMNSIFWDILGFLVLLGMQGVLLNVNLLVLVLQGGVEFVIVCLGGGLVENGYVFCLQFDQEIVEVNLILDEVNVLCLIMLIDEFVKGLEIGVNVQFMGLIIGWVINLVVCVVKDDQGQDYVE